MTATPSTRCAFNAVHCAVELIGAVEPIGAPQRGTMHRQKPANITFDRRRDVQ